MNRWISVAVAAFFATLTFTASAQAVTISETSAGITGMGLTNIALGADGNMWFTENVNPAKIGKIEPNGTVTEYSTGLTANSQPSDITAGPGGNMWFIETFGNRIGKITPDGTVTEYPLTTPAANPFSLAAGPDGNLWFTEYSTSKIGRMTPDGSVDEFTNNLTPASNPLGITAGPDGNLWFVETGANKIGKITTAGLITEYSTGITPNAQLTDITAGPDGNLWFTEQNSFSAGRIGRITPAGVVTEFTVPPAMTDSDPNGITAGPDGNVWFTNQNQDMVGRVKPDGTITQYGMGITAGGGPRGIAADNDGTLRFTEVFAKRIGRVVTDAPAVTTNAADTLTDTGANLKAVVNARDFASDVKFEYGPTATYGTTSSARTESGASDTAVAIPVTGLTPSTTYHYRVVASSSEGKSIGKDLTFTTTAKVTPPPGGLKYPTKTTATFDGKNLAVLLSCPARFKPKCASTSSPLTKKIKGKAMATAVKSNTLSGKYKAVRYLIKPNFRATVQAMTTKNSKQLIVKQLIRSKKVGNKKAKRPTAIFHTYKVRVQG